jgi:hypothetical protein
MLRLLVWKVHGVRSISHILHHLPASSNLRYRLLGIHRIKTGGSKISLRILSLHHSLLEGLLRGHHRIVLKIISSLTLRGMLRGHTVEVLLLILLFKLLRPVKIILIRRNGSRILISAFVEHYRAADVNKGRTVRIAAHIGAFQGYFVYFL